jgi:trimethylamine--corrinoid protein Co-methyltransferase
MVQKMHSDMMQSSPTLRAQPMIRMLSDDQIAELISAAMEIMDTIGFKVLSPEARTIFQKAGAVVDRETVRVPQFVVRKALAAAPQGWTIYDRNGNQALEAAGRMISFGTATASPNTIDPFTGEYRETRIKDIARSALIADALEHIDWVMPMGSAQDIPQQWTDVQEFLAVVQNTAKPILLCASSTEGAERVCTLAAAIAGTWERLRNRPFLVLYTVPLTPLVLPGPTVEQILLAAERFLPQIMGPTMQPGATSPVTLAGAVAQGLAESLMCLSLAQLHSPGCPVGLGCNFTNFDMHQGLAGIGNPEMSLALTAQAEVAQSLGLPTLGLAGGTDAKVLDAQAGAEAAFHLLAQAQAGLNLIHDVGYMDMSMACSLEQLVLGNEIIGMVKQYLKGIEVSRERLCLKPTAGVGQTDHLFGPVPFRQSPISQKGHAAVFTRESYASWKAAGHKETRTRVREQIHSLLKTHQPSALPLPVLQNLERIQKEAATSCVNQAG